MSISGFSTGLVILLVGGTSALTQSQTETYTYDVHGRLIATNVYGGAHNDDARSTCYDELGNRRTFRVSIDGTVLTCSAPSTQNPPNLVSSPPVPPNDPPATSNTAPQATTDNIAGRCDSFQSVDIVANDIDADGDTLTLLSVRHELGITQSYITVVNGVAQVSFGLQSGSDRWLYEVADSYGATATGFIYLSTSCREGGAELN